MLVVTSESLVPPGGAYVAKHPESGVVFRHHTVNGVWSKYNEHCRANNWPELTRQQVVDNICENTKANICHDTDAPTLVQQIKSFAHDMVDWARAGFPASMAAVEARQPICDKCPHYRGPTGGSFFSIACAKCGCSGLKLAIHTSVCGDKAAPRWGQFKP